MVEPLTPKGDELLEHGLRLVERLALNFEAVEFAALDSFDDSRALEDFEMPRNGGGGDREGPGQSGDVMRRIRHSKQYPPARRIGQGLKHAVELR